MTRYDDDGACGRDRTADTRFTRAVLCQLSYASIHGGHGRIRTSEPGKGRFYRPLRLATPPHAQDDDRIAHDACHWQACSRILPLFSFLPSRVPLGWHVVPHAVAVTPFLRLASRGSLQRPAGRSPCPLSGIRHACGMPAMRSGGTVHAKSCWRHRAFVPSPPFCPWASSSASSRLSLLPADALRFVIFMYSSYAVVKVRKRKSGTAGLVSSQRVPDSRISTYVPSALLHGHPGSVWGRGAIIIVHAQIAREDTREHAKRDIILPCLLLTLVFALGDGHRVFASSGSALVGRCPLPFR